MKAEARAAEAGHATVEVYVAALVRADVDGGDEAGNEPELEAVLLRRLESTEPGVEATPQFWERLRDEARAGRDAGGGR